MMKRRKNIKSTHIYFAACHHDEPTTNTQLNNSTHSLTSFNSKSNNMNLRISGLFIAAITSASRANAFTVIRSSRIAPPVPAYRTAQVVSFSSRTTKTTPLYATVPEPSPCPKCSDENSYWDGSLNFVCIACEHEWLVESADADVGSDDGANDGIVRDSNGNVLESGDTVVLTKELGKGLKKGLKITRIRIGDYGDDHDVQASIAGLGTFNLKSQFLKKTSK